MISIFAKRAFLNVNSSQEFVDKGTNPRQGHLLRVSSMIRADQIADRIGAKLNPTEGYEDDVCVYVKPHIKKGNMEFHFEGKRAYIDIIDGHNLGELMAKYPDVGVIVCSQADYEIMKKEIPNKIVLIPQHHCNYDRVLRSRSAIDTIGTIGEIPAFAHIPDEIRNGIEERGMKLVEFSKFYRRKDIIDFYQSIDIQLVWRPWRKVLSNPLKIVNASSFGVPTIALDEPAFKEVEGCYMPVHAPWQFLEAVDKLRSDPYTYEEYSKRCQIKSEDYHIDKIGKLYMEL